MAVPRVMQRQGWVVEEHSWSRVAHDLLDFLFHVWAVAVDEAFAARALLVLEGALVKPRESVLLELPAFRAEFSVGAMVVSAVDVYHVAYGFLFTFHSLVFWIRRLRLHRNQRLKHRAVRAHKGLP